MAELRSPPPATPPPPAPSGSTRQTRATVPLPPTTWQATVNGPLDFRQYQTIGVTNGSVITAITFAQTGQVARILVAGGGAITLPATGMRLPQGGAVWGGTYTLVSFVNVDPSVTLVAFTPYD